MSYQKNNAENNPVSNTANKLDSNNNKSSHDANADRVRSKRKSELERLSRLPDNPTVKVLAFIALIIDERSGDQYV